jgi:hypothetical protein
MRVELGITLYSVPESRDVLDDPLERDKTRLARGFVVIPGVGDGVSACCATRYGVGSGRPVT